MPIYKPVERGMMLLAIDFAEQIIPGSFEFTLNHLVDQELDLSRLDARFKNDHTGASAYDPRVMLKIVLLAYSRGLISSRAIAQACEKNIVFMALGGDCRPSYTHIAKFVRELGEDIKPLFAQVLITCDSMGLIGKELFAIDGVKLSSNASKERSGTHAELLHRANRLNKAAAKIIERHREQDEGKTDQPLDARRQAQVARIRKEAQTTREFVARTRKKTNAKGVELKGRVIQFVRQYFEGKKPAFVDDIMRLKIGPFFLAAELAFLLGLRKDLQGPIEAQAGPTRINS